MKLKTNNLFFYSFGIFSLFVAFIITGCWKNKKPSPGMLSNVSSNKAITLANEWSEKKLKIRSFVNTRGVNFLFPDKRKAVVPIKGEKMYIAIAPYINKTHT